MGIQHIPVDAYTKKTLERGREIGSDWVWSEKCGVWTALMCCCSLLISSAKGRSALSFGRVCVAPVWVKQWIKMYAYAQQNM